MWILISDSLEVCGGAGEFVEGYSRQIWVERVWASKEGREGYGVSLQKTIRKGEKL